MCHAALELTFSQNKRCSKLCGASTQLHYCIDPSTVHDAASCNDWKTALGAKQSHQSQSSHLAVALRIEYAAMPSRFISLSILVSTVLSIVTFSTAIYLIDGGLAA